MPPIETSPFFAWVDRALAANPEGVRAYREGRTNVLGTLVAAVLAESGGRADPRLVVDTLRTNLNP